MADDNRGVSVVSPPPPPPPPPLPPSLPSPPLLATVVALRARRAVVCTSGAHRVHMYATYLSPFSEINKQCRGHSSRAPAGKVVSCLVFLVSPQIARLSFPSPFPLDVVLTADLVDETRFRAARRASRCQSVPEMNRLPNHYQELSVTGSAGFVRTSLSFSVSLLVSSSKGNLMRLLKRDVSPRDFQRECPFPPVYLRVSVAILSAIEVFLDIACPISTHVALVVILDRIVTNQHPVGLLVSTGLFYCLRFFQSTSLCVSSFRLFPYSVYFFPLTCSATLSQRLLLSIFIASLCSTLLSDP